MIRHKTIVVFFLLFATGTVMAQRKLADSIEAVLAKPMPDSLRAVAMVNRAMYYEPLDSAKAQQLYKEAQMYAEERKLYYAAGLCIRFRLTPELSKGAFKKHMTEIEKALQYLSLSKNPKARLQEGLLMGDKGSGFYYDGMYDSAAAWFIKGIEVLENNNWYGQTATLYTNLSGCYEVLQLKDKQKEYTFKGLASAKNSGQPYHIFSSYLMVSQYFAGQKNFTEALQYCDSALLYYDTVTISVARLQLYYLMRAQAHEGLERYDSSVYYFGKAYEITKRNEDVWGMTEPLLRMGFGNMKLKKMAEAGRLLNQGIALAEENNFLVFKKLGYEFLSKYHEEAGDYSKALDFYKKYYVANDSLQNEESRKIMLDLEKKYETEKKEKQLIVQEASIRQKNTLNYILAGSAVMLLLLSLLSYRNYRQKQKLQQQKIAELEKEKLLSATQSILKGQEEERSRMAKDLHDGLGGLLSGVKLQLGAMKGNLILSEEHGRIFNNALGKLDESISEMRRVAHNMMPEALMNLGLQQALQDYCEGLSAAQPFTINGEFHGLEKRMNPATEVVIYRIVQELLNNAVKHSGAGNILAQVMRQDNAITITVEDNGKGFDKEAVLQGAGLKNIRSRVEYLKGQMDIQTAPGRGTSVHIDCTLDN